MTNPLCISVPAALADRIEADAVVIRSARCAEIVKAFRRRGERIQGVLLESVDDDLINLAELPVGMFMTVKMHPREAAQIYTSSWMSDRFNLGVLMDIDVGLLQGVRIVTSAGVSVMLNPDEVYDTGELLSVLHYYLHEPHLQVPVEFFHSLFNAYLNNTPVSLEEMYPESPDTFLYVDELGRISGSARLACAGEFFGEVRDSLTLDTTCNAYKSLLDRRKNIFLSGSACASCEHFDVCGAYLRFVEKEFDCDPFKKTFEQIKAKAREFAEDLSSSALSGE